MSGMEMLSEKYDTLLKEAIRKLKDFELDEAYQCILDAIHEDPNSPEPQNLLGILYELKGDNDLARKHYRIAYVLSPTFKPASENLERVSTLFPIKKIKINFGDTAAEEFEGGKGCKIPEKAQ
jgi:tetratricopeptide (TPR) repeat protein